MKRDADTWPSVLLPHNNIFIFIPQPEKGFLAFIHIHRLLLIFICYNGKKLSQKSERKYIIHCNLFFLPFLNGKMFILLQYLRVHFVEISSLNNF